MRFIALGVLILLASCGVSHRAPKEVSAPPFPDAEYIQYARPGNSTLSGQVFSKTVDGTVKIGAGSQVYLEPKTSYSSFILNHANVVNIDPKRDDFRRSARAGADGTYKFRNLPAGEYYVSATVTWDIPVYTKNYWTGGYDASMSTQGGTGIQSFRIGRNETIDDAHVMPFDSAR